MDLLTGRRLAYYNLEVRDFYFSRLKSKIEIFKKQNKQKVILCSHSYVSLLDAQFRADTRKNGRNRHTCETSCSSHVEKPANEIQFLYVESRIIRHHSQYQLEMGRSGS